MRIGLYFGSFNPVHVGHLIIASYARHAGNFQQVWFVVSPQNPLKNPNSLLNEYDRLHLVNTAIANDPFLKTCDIEFYLPKPSYTVHTLAYLQEKYPQHDFGIILGSDSLQNLPQWKNYETILSKYAICVFKRRGFEVKEYEGASITIIDAPLLEISSTQVRQMIQKNMSIRYMVTEAVANDIEQNRHYK